MHWRVLHKPGKAKPHPSKHGIVPNRYHCPTSRRRQQFGQTRPARWRHVRTPRAFVVLAELAFMSASCLGHLWGSCLRCVPKYPCKVEGTLVRNLEGGKSSWSEANLNTSKVRGSSQRLWRVPPQHVVPCNGCRKRVGLRSVPARNGCNNVHSTAGVKACANTSAYVNGDNMVAQLCKGGSR